MALAAVQTTDLIELSQMLVDSVKETIAEEKMPYRDPAVRLICHQIAFAGNGDVTFHTYYEDIVTYCVAMVGLDQLGVPTKKDLPNEPVYKAS